MLQKIFDTHDLQICYINIILTITNLYFVTFIGLVDLLLYS